MIISGSKEALLLQKAHIPFFWVIFPLEWTSIEFNSIIDYTISANTSSFHWKYIKTKYVFLCKMFSRKIKNYMKFTSTAIRGLKKR